MPNLAYIQQHYLYHLVGTQTERHGAWRGGKQPFRTHAEAVRAARRWGWEIITQEEAEEILNARKETPDGRTG